MSQPSTWADARRTPSDTSQVESDVFKDFKPADEKAHIIFVPGHWHNLFHTRPVVAELEKAGYEITPHQLASVGLKTPVPTFADDVNGIVAAVSRVLDAGQDAILVLHSYAGMPGSEAVNKLLELSTQSTNPTPNRGILRRIVYIAAYMFPANFVMDAKLFIGDSDPMFSIDETKSLTYFKDPYHGFFNDMTREDAQPFLDHVDDTYYLGTGPCITSENWREMPNLYLLTERDQAMPLERQEGISTGMPRVRLDAGHDPFVSRPGVVAEILGRVASSQ